MRRPRRAYATPSCFCFSVLLSAGVSSAQPVMFTDVTAAAGVASSYHVDPGSTGQLMAAGGAAGDFNNDGWQDLFVLGGYDQPDRLFINNRNGTFSEQGAAWGVNRTHRSFGVAVGDYDRDGWLDIFVTSEVGGTGYQYNCLYHNNHNGTFTDMGFYSGLAYGPNSDFGGSGWGVAWGDYDLDGCLDLAIADWYNPASGNALYHNNRDGTLTDVTSSTVGSALRGSQGYSPRFVDMNGDRYPELLWTSDFGRSKYLINNRNGTFTNATASAGVGLDGNGMGAAIGDFNGDGRPDWFVTSVYSPTPTPQEPGTGNMLYMNQGNHHFSEVGQAAGVKQGGWAWGVVAADLDLDGRLDVAHTNGWVSAEFLADQTCVFLNTAPSGDPAQFQQVAPACGVTHTGQGRGMLAFDYDNDGDMDLVIFTNGGPLVLYRNEARPAAGHYLRVFLNSRATPLNAPNGYGAHLQVTTGGLTQHRWICGGSNYLSQDELSAHFGLGTAAAIDQLRIDWPDGRIQTFAGVAADRTITVSSCPGDFNRDGLISVQDLFDFLGAYFNNAADFNYNGATTLQDIFDFLAAWFTPCP